MVLFMKKLTNAISAFAKRVSKIFEGIKSLFIKASQAKEEVVERSTHRNSWTTVWDNRRECQVISRKPLSFVRKVI